MSGEVLSQTFELINLSQLAPSVPLGADKIGVDWKKSADDVAELVKEIRTDYGFLEKLAEQQPLGGFNEGFKKHEKLTFNERRLIETANLTKEMAQEFKDDVKSLGKIYKMLGVMSDFLKDQRFFSDRLMVTQASKYLG